ncbi:hypothetical protein NKH33_07915 [Mesorhizobium sp. M1182]|uniref:LVIVD repeat-containing protein n=1 Tax=Mesorhizobium sp. M1182 TaxID=2957067 RepID=UPI00333A5B0F
MKNSEISRRQMLKVPLIGATIAATSQSGLVCEALAQPVPASSPAPPGAFAHNVEAVGYTDLDHRPAFKMAIRQVGERWYLYTGHFWHSGWSIVDVTDPAKPETVKFVPYLGTNTWTLQIDLSGDTMVTALEKPFANFGGDPDAPFGEGVLIWDIADPINPKQLSHYRTGGNGTHRNLYPVDVMSTLPPACRVTGATSTSSSIFRIARIRAKPDAGGCRASTRPAARALRLRSPPPTRRPPIATGCD